MSGLLFAIKIKKVQMDSFWYGRKNCLIIPLDTFITQILHGLALVLHNFRPIHKVCR